MMKKPTRRGLTGEDWRRKRDDWLAKVGDLMDSIKAWAGQRRWFVDEQEKAIVEDHIGPYTVPILFIQAPAGKIHVEPIGCNIVGAEGRVDIESFPALNRLLLILVDGQWKIKTDSRVDWPEPWSETAFVRLVDALTSAA
jgi:hypothetical protein